MIGFMIAIFELLGVLLYAFLKITGLWASLLIITLAMMFNAHIMPISDNIAAIIIYLSLVPSIILFIRNIVRICINIYTFISRLCF